MENRIIDSLINMAQQSQEDTKGGNKKCFISGEYALLEGHIDEDKIQKLIRVGADLKDRGVDLARTLDYKITDDGTVYTLQERAKGVPLHNRLIQPWKWSPEQFTDEQKKYLERLQTIAEEKQEIFDKFTSDWIEILKAGRQIDPSKVDNFYYQQGHGITFIDLDNERTENSQLDMKTVCYEIACILMAGTKYQRLAKGKDVKSVVDSNISKIFAKFAKSIGRAGMNIEDIKKVFSEKFEYIDLSGLDKNIEEQMKDSGDAVITPEGIVSSTINRGSSTQDINSVTQAIRENETKDIQKGVAK